MINFIEKIKMNLNQDLPSICGGQFSGIKLKHIPFNETQKRKSSPINANGFQLDNRENQNSRFSFGKHNEFESKLSRTS